MTKAVKLPATMFIATVIVALLSDVALCEQADTDEAPDMLHRLIGHDAFLAVGLFSMLGWFVGKGIGTAGSADWAAKHLKAKGGKLTAVVFFVADFCIFVVSGAFIGTAIFDPATIAEAVAAGFGWPLALGHIVTGKGANIELPDGAVAKDVRPKPLVVAVEEGQ